MRAVQASRGWCGYIPEKQNLEPKENRFMHATHILQMGERPGRDLKGRAHLGGELRCGSQRYIGMLSKTGVGRASL